AAPLRHNEPLALVVLGPRDPQRTGRGRKGPVARRTPLFNRPQPAHHDAAIYRLGRAEVQCARNAMEAELDPALQISWVRGVIWDDEATAETDGAPADPFAQQFAGGAPIKGQRKPVSGDGPAQQRAMQRRHQASADPRKVALDAELQQGFDSLREQLSPRGALAETCKSPCSPGQAQLGKRSLSATLGIEPARVRDVFGASGQRGATIDIPLDRGIPPPDTASKCDVIWHPDPWSDFATAYADSVKLKSEVAEAVSLAIRGSAAALATAKCRIAGLGAAVATRGQIPNVIATARWVTEVRHAGRGETAAGNFALPKADAAPPATTLKAK
ncbi:unnamed protein product, partial [Prorocentrum cordatum]